MKIRFWGTRGSVPTPGKNTARYGGNTPCVEVRLDDNKLIILDAGTGIRALGESLGPDGPVEAHILITHPHWDHIQGFPFFRPVYREGNRITIVGAESDRVSLQKMIADQMNKIYFPIHLDELKAKLQFRRVGEEEFRVYGAVINTLFVNHPSFALGYRIRVGERSLVYISDNEPFDRSNESMKRNIEPWILEKYMRNEGDPNQRVYDFVRGADILIHDTTYTPEEYATHATWGHSHFLFSLDVAKNGKVKKLVLFHHDPVHTDDKVDEILQRCRDEITKQKLSMECVAAAEGMELVL